MKNELSFSVKVKEELAKHYSTAKHCGVAEVAAIISMCGKVCIDCDDQYSIKVSTENASIARKYFTLLKKTFNIDKDVFMSECQAHGKDIYSVHIKKHSDAIRILEATKLLDEDGDVTQKICCRRAYLRGAFLVGGSITDPEKSYHLEIVCASEYKAQQLKGIIDSFDLEAKIVVRKKTYVVYLKDGSQIVDLLNVMNAPVALMEFENVRIVKDMRNSVNRKVNCETANINKTVSAAVKQMNDIIYIRDEIGFDALSESLEEMARVRLNNPEATLKELGELLSEPVGKSGVNHRLRKLSEIAEKHREQGGI